MKLTAHWPNDLEMPKVVHNVQFIMTNAQSVLLIGQSVVEFIEVFRSMTNCRICRRIVIEHWPNANEKRCSTVIHGRCSTVYILHLLMFFFFVIGFNTYSMLSKHSNIHHFWTKQDVT